MVELAAPPPVAVDEDSVGELRPGLVAAAVALLLCPLLFVVSAVASVFVFGLFFKGWDAAIVPGAVPPALAALAVGRWALAPEQRASRDARSMTYASVGLFLLPLGLLWLAALLGGLR